MAETQAQAPSNTVAAGSDTLWFYLDASGQHTGPYIASAFKDLLSGGYVSGATLVWAEGRAGWEALQDVPKLWPEGAAAAISAVPSTDVQQGAAPASQPAPAASRQGAGAATKAVRAAKAAITPVDKELAAFQAEMSALGATAAPAAGDAAADEATNLPEDVRAETPPPDERRFEDDDGTVFVWDGALRRFVEEGDVGAVSASKAPDYKVEEMTFELEEEKIPIYRPPIGDADGEGLPDQDPLPGGSSGNGGAPAEEGQAAQERKKGAAESVLEKHAERAKRAREAAEEKWRDLKHITSVYISGLPDDATEDEIAKVFAKCGILKEDDDGRPRVKIYRDKGTGMSKGDGLVSYLKEPSVDLACKILDGAPFRDDISKPLSVQRARFEMKGGEFVARKKPKKKPKKPGAKVDKMLGWGGFDDQLNPTKVTVVLKHMFAPADLLEEPTLKDDLEADILAECTKLGPVDKVRVYPNHPEGVVSVKFKGEEAAEACLKLMHGRFFGGRQLSAVLWDGIANYNVKRQETPEEEAARLERFAAEIEGA